MLKMVKTWWFLRRWSVYYHKEYLRRSLPFTGFMGIIGCWSLDDKYAWHRAVAFGGLPDGFYKAATIAVLGMLFTAVFREIFILSITCLLEPNERALAKHIRDIANKWTFAELGRQIGLGQSPEATFRTLAEYPFLWHELWHNSGEQATENLVQLLSYGNLPVRVFTAVPWLVCGAGHRLPRA